MSSASSSKLVVNELVLDCRYRDRPVGWALNIINQLTYRDHSLVAETNETLFVYDEVRDKLARVAGQRIHIRKGL